MTFSKEWDQAYRDGTQMSVWPWSDLVGYVKRYMKPLKSKMRVLELGCGAGANIPFFLQLDAEYYAIEGSPAIVKVLWKRFPKIKKNIVVGDFTKEIPFKGSFDLVVDRSSMTHNTTKSIREALDMIHSKLVPGGKYIGIDWFSTRDHGFKLGKSAGDAYTREKFPPGRFLRVGRTHFSDQAHLKSLFKKFNLEIMEHKTVEIKQPANSGMSAAWNFVAVRRDVK